MTDNDLFFVCSLIEFIGRERKLPRADVVNQLGRDNIKRLLEYADVFHCEPIEKVADDFITECKIPMGDYDNISSCEYRVPDFWDIGDVYARLVEDVNIDKQDIVDKLIEVFNSFMCQSISNFNSDLYYQPREYLRECYLEGNIIDY